MFDGVPDQFHQFISSSIPPATTVPLPLPFPPPLHHASNSPPFPPPFDPLYTSSPSNSHPFFLHQKISQEKEDNTLVGVNVERQRSIDHHHPWSNEEVFALLRVRSSMENWFPEFAWDHVSRKLAELGFKRSAEKCKEKFEEESRYFNSNITCSKNIRIFSELEVLCHGDQNNPSPPPPAAAAEPKKNQSLENHGDEEEGHEDDSRNNDYGHDHDHQTVGDLAEDCNEKVVDGDDDGGDQKAKSRKRRRGKKFEMFKGFCEDVVNKLLAQQEELHNKLLEDMVKRDEEKVAREEAWKKQEMDRINKELELRAQEQAIAGDRQATIIKFLSKFAPNSGPVSSSSLALEQNSNFPITNNQTIDDQGVLSSSSTMSQMKPSSLTENPAPQNPNSPLAPTTPKAPTSSPSLTPQNPNSLNAPKAPENTIHISDHKEDLGKRWPRDEVLALINLRCSLFNSTNTGEEKEGGTAVKAPLWERISQGMLELGYKRSAKRCKEKWENINKYFRKTKDNNKKRPMDSRTCPYFHQLSTLYNQGTLVAPSEGQETQPALLGDHSGSETRVGTDSTVAQVPTFDFGF